MGKESRAAPRLEEEGPGVGPDPLTSTQYFLSPNEHPFTGVWR